MDRRSFLISLASAAALPVVTFAEPVVPRLALYSREGELLAVSEDLTEFFRRIPSPDRIRQLVEPYIDTFTLQWNADRSAHTAACRWLNLPRGFSWIRDEYPMVRRVVMGDTVNIDFTVSA